MHTHASSLCADTPDTHTHIHTHNWANSWKTTSVALLVLNRGYRLLCFRCVAHAVILFTHTNYFKPARPIARPCFFNLVFVLLSVDPYFDAVLVGNRVK